jgi:hypothetical protein
MRAFWDPKMLVLFSKLYQIIICQQTTTTKFCTGGKIFIPNRSSNAEFNLLAPEFSI